jgi:predicted glycosyltransferase
MTVETKTMSGPELKLDSQRLSPAAVLVKGHEVVATRTDSSGKIWIDLDNSPHVPFFAPIIEELEQAGYGVLVTARDCFQVCELADLLKLNYRRVGRHYGKNPVWKLAGLGWRSLQLVPAVLGDRPVLALSHGSRSQLLVANMLRIPSVTIADYEFAKIWMLVRPTWVMTPEIIAESAIHARKENILKYPGIKEDVYVPRFNPDPSLLAKLGLDERDVIVLVRPPATEAHYHRPESDELFEEVLNFLGSKPQVKMILLPRNQRQGADIRSKWAALFATGQILIPNSVLDGLNLIWHSDLVISGGGTMNREATALGVPVYSIFRGEIGAVDRYLASTGRLMLIESREEVASKLRLNKRDRYSDGQERSNITLNTIVQHITGILKES